MGDRKKEEIGTTRDEIIRGDACQNWVYRGMLSPSDLAFLVTRGGWGVERDGTVSDLVNSQSHEKIVEGYLEAILKTLIEPKLNTEKLMIRWNRHWRDTCREQLEKRDKVVESFWEAFEKEVRFREGQFTEDGFDQFDVEQAEEEDIHGLCDCFVAQEGFHRRFKALVWVCDLFGKCLEQKSIEPLKEAGVIGVDA